MNSKYKIPVILYEEDKSGKSNIIPYIEVGKEDTMPPVLFISEYKETGEFEPDPNFGSRPIVDMLIHQYIDMELLKQKLDGKTLDKIRVAIGLKPLKEAKKEGKKMMNKVFLNANLNKTKIETIPEEKEKRVFEIGEHLKTKLKSILNENKKQSEKEDLK